MKEESKAKRCQLQSIESKEEWQKLKESSQNSSRKKKKKEKKKRNRNFTNGWSEREA